MHFPSLEVPFVDSPIVRDLHSRSVEFSVQDLAGVHTVDGDLEATLHGALGDFGQWEDRQGEVLLVGSEGGLETEHFEETDDGVVFGLGVRGGCGAGRHL